MSTTYKNFLIHSNLRCYIDNHGKLEPKFIYSDFKTIEECKQRIDRYYEEWEAWQQRRNINYARSLQILTDDTDRSDEAREQEAARFEDKMNEYYEREHYFGNE